MKKEKSPTLTLKVFSVLLHAAHSVRSRSTHLAWRTLLQMPFRKDSPSWSKKWHPKKEQLIAKWRCNLTRLSESSILTSKRLLSANASRRLNGGKTNKLTFYKNLKNKRSLTANKTPKTQFCTNMKTAWTEKLTKLTETDQSLISVEMKVTLELTSHQTPKFK